MADLNVFGYTRFSYFGKSDTKVSRELENDAERFDALYNPTRMAQRFHLFDNICLPSLRSQKNQNFKHIVVASNVMPDVYKKQLRRSVADIPQIELLFSDEKHVTYALNPRIKEMVEGIKGNTVHFRLDDDDAICAQTVEMLSSMSKSAHGKSMISFPRGLFLLSNPRGTHLLRKFEPYIAIAFAFVNKPGYIRNPYQCRHGKAFQTVPSQMEPRPFAYIHSAHASSDTVAAQGRKLRSSMKFDPDYQNEESRRSISRILEERFPDFTYEGLIEIMESMPR